ncbi:hypothetical protein [uncultured Sphingomonas sp.]|uniref:hypothetical protein n=1 Tax=uncultured Sphingomonas sp. TaxID=158754 RepID=UPI0025F97153|nr:hypothetical protein [uncultured Sphingomonas sp.]
MSAFEWLADIAAGSKLADGSDMYAQFTIDPQTGSLGVGNVRLRPLQLRSEVEPQVAQWIESSRDHGNGFRWLYLARLTFGGQPAFVGLCFRVERLEQASWTVQLPDAPVEGGWPTREAIDSEVAFVREALARDGLNANFNWGEVWSSFDAKGFIASNGLRYRTS